MIEYKSDDNTTFVDTVWDLAVRTAESEGLSDIHVVRIDHWFGIRWFGFAGKILGALGVRNLTRLPVPPFHPNRVSEEQHYHCTPEGDWNGVERKSIHLMIPSETNVPRCIAAAMPRSVVVWFSGRSADEQRASVMVYTTLTNRETIGWYAELCYEGRWRLVASTGSDRRLVEQALAGMIGVMHE